MPLSDAAGFDRPGARAHAVQVLECTVDITRGGNLECEPAAGANGVASGGPNYNLVVGSQHRFVRLSNDPPVVEGSTWKADVTVQNLTLQPMATEDGETPEADGVRIFFVDEPNNGVEVLNADGVGTFTGSELQKYYEYSGGLLGDDGILSPGETSGAKTWEFELNGATQFRFSVLVWTEVPNPNGYSVHLTRISASWEHTCADGDDGKVYCWGSNRYGQLGDGTNTWRLTPVADRLTPVAVQAPEGVELSGVSAGDAHTCADGDDGKVYCWGYNEYGQLGDGTYVWRNAPVAVQAPDGVELSGVSAGANHTCAHGNDGKVYCWGDNESGQLGDGTDTIERFTPVVVQAPEGVELSGVSAGYWHTCADGSDGKVYCWGDNWYGQLGDGTTTEDPIRVPVAVRAPAGITLLGVTAGGSYTCALRAAGPAYCWGSNDVAQLGTGTTVDSSVPVFVAGTH